MRFTAICAAILGVAMATGYLLFAKWIIGVFISNAEVIQFGVRMLRAMMVSCPVIGIMFVFMLSMQAMGKAGASLILTTSRQGLIFIPFILIGKALFGLNGIIFAQPVADAASLLIAIALYLRINRQLNETE